MTTTQSPTTSSPTESRSRSIRVSGFSQWLTLSERYTRAMVGNGEILTSLLAPIVFTAGFYLPLRSIMGQVGIDYAQYIMPIIVLQAMSFVAIAAAMRSAHESVTGMSARMRTMPIAILAPSAGRITASTVRCIISLAMALVCGFVIGFRFDDAGTAVAFCGFALAIGVVLAIGADALGTLTRNPEATSQVLTLPMLILGMLSTGYVPLLGFPTWIRWFVKNQPVSHWCAMLRSLSEGNGAGTHLMPSIWWLLGLAVVFIAMAIPANVRRG